MAREDREGSSAVPHPGEPTTGSDREDPVKEAASARQDSAREDLAKEDSVKEAVDPVDLDFENISRKSSTPFCLEVTSHGQRS